MTRCTSRGVCTNSRSGAPSPTSSTPSPSGAGIELNDNTAYTDWWQGRIRPFLDAGIMVVFTHLTGHAKPGVGRTRDSAVRNATQIRALSTQVLECRQVADTRYRLIHNKHRNSTGLRFGFLELEGASDDPHVRLTVTAADTPADAANKQALARLRLIDLAQAHPVLDRKLIEKTLNDRTKPDAERVSDKVWESVIAEMTSEKLFKTPNAVTPTPGPGSAAHRPPRATMTPRSSEVGDRWETGRATTPTPCQRAGIPPTLPVGGRWETPTECPVYPPRIAGCTGTQARSLFLPPPYIKARWERQTAGTREARP